MSLGALIEGQRNTGLLWAPVAFGLGIAAYFSLAVEPGTLLLLALGIAALAAAGAGLRWRFAPLLLLALLALGLVRAGHHTRMVAEPVLDRVYYGPVWGRVAGLDRSSSNRVRVLLDRVALAEPGAAPDRVRLVLMGAPDAAVLRPGAEIMTTARLTPPPPPAEPGGFDFRRHAWFQGLGAIGSAPNPVLLQKPGVTTDGIGLFALRIALADAIRARMPDRTGGFAAAILTGDRSAIAPEDLVDLRASNLAHLLAISGLHMGLLCGFVFLVVRSGLALVPPLALRVPIRKIAASVALAAGLGYLLVSGASVATQRAFIMAAVVLVAMLLDRPALTLRAVAIAAMIVLALRPESLLSPGFQMSFAATTALIWCFEGLTRSARWQALDRGWRRGMRTALVIVITSAVAGAATAPFSAFHFNQVSQYGLIANVLAVPAMGLLVMPAAVLALALIPFGAEWIGLALMDRGIAHILRVADWVAGFEAATRPVASVPTPVLGLLTVGLIAMVILRGRLRLLGVPVAAMALAGWAMAGRPDVLISDSGRLIGVLQPEGRVLSRARGDGFAARVWLENDGDTADQRDAAARGVDRGGYALTIGAHLVRQVAEDDGPPACLSKTVLILAAAASGQDGPCLMLDDRHFRRHGATAVFLGDKMRVVTVSDRSGLRPWTGYVPD